MKGAAGLDTVRSAVRAIAAGPTHERGGPSGRGLRPLLTISREAGIDAAAVTMPLVSSLTARASGGDPPWITYDRALVERVAADHNLGRDLVARLDESDRSWFEHLAAGLTGVDTGADVAMKTAQTIRALARIGRSIIVGRGGQCVLAGLPHVLHVRLIAPADWRAERHAAAASLEPKDAEEAIREIDRERARFIKRHFQSDVTNPLLYHVIVNVGLVAPAAAADAIATMIGELEQRL